MRTSLSTNCMHVHIGSSPAGRKASPLCGFRPQEPHGAGCHLLPGTVWSFLGVGAGPTAREEQWPFVSSSAAAEDSRKPLSPPAPGSVQQAAGGAPQPTSHFLFFSLLVLLLPNLSLCFTLVARSQAAGLQGGETPPGSMEGGGGMRIAPHLMPGPHPVCSCGRWCQRGQETRPWHRSVPRLHHSTTHIGPAVSFCGLRPFPGCP